ncbi:MAG: HAMP domain-containing histidine kinase [Odoribacteraceae bacterium]|jgi:signal transduction histidine kinase|nr:HAMP domain-containing histidine kinase [Odoribacteraceae bacterium]
MKKIVFVLLLATALVAVASLWESIFAPSSDRQRLEAFERGLHREERWADEMLAELRGEREPHWTPWKFKEFSLLCFKDRQLLYWNNERVGIPGLYDALNEGNGVKRINNAYYDARRRSEGNLDYFALIFIQDDYPHANRYVKNHVNPALGSSRVHILESDAPGGIVLRDRHGAPLFRVDEEVVEVDRGPNYLVLALYTFALYLLFYVYKLLLAGASTARGRLTSMLLFLVIFSLICCVTRYFRVPRSLYDLALYQTRLTSWRLAWPVGDLFISIFCAVHFFYITFQYFRAEWVSARRRYLFMFSLLAFTFAYMNILGYSIDSLISNTLISLNVARVMHVDASSIVAFVTLIIGAMGYLVLVGGSIRQFAHLFPARETIVGTVVAWCGFALAGELFDLPVAWQGCLFALLLHGLLIMNAYAVKGDARKIISLVTIVLVSMYTTGLSRASEMQREWVVRANFADEIIRERDESFEEKLAEVDQKVRRSRALDSLVRAGEHATVTRFLLERLTDLTGYHYAGRVSFSSAEWDRLIDSAGIPVAGTSFYNINDFDGFTTYIGRFDFPPDDSARLYFRFDSKMENDRPGYQQILSREPARPVSSMYPYSYAKYRDGRLLYSHGDYNYERTLPLPDGEYSRVQATDLNGYTHMIVPVGESGHFIISLGKGFFAPYSLNILYAILVCLLFSSYGIFFQAGRREWRRRDASFARRIRDNILVLVCGLMLVTTWLSIMTISAGYERRRSQELLTFSKIINRELEQHEQVEAALWPGITRELERVANVIQVDVNIYSTSGELVATSLPLVFERGLDGMLLNPEAHRRVTREHANSFVQEERVGELSYMAVYMPLELENGKRYVLSIPYFSKSDELNREIFFLVIISVNVAIIVIILTLFLSHVVAGRMVKPLRMVNEKLRRTRLGGKNERIVYNKQDEVGALVKEYNDMVDKLEESARKLSRAEREAAWQKMARQVAHEIKNPLTPMKLNIQFLQRAMRENNVEHARARFEDLSSVLIEQIDHMAAIATAFADFAKVSVATNEWFNFSERVEGCARLFANEARMVVNVEPGIFLFGDKEQVHRVLVNLLKNAEQSIPEGRPGMISVTLARRAGQIILEIQDNGSGIPEEARERVAEPNFTTKSGGMGLGLPISYRIVESMGGTIHFETEVNVGTTFIVAFKEMNRE